MSTGAMHGRRDQAPSRQQTEERGHVHHSTTDGFGYFLTFPGEIWAAPRSWVEAVYPGVAYFNEVDRGGHFAAWEEPELFSAEVREAFRSLR